MKYPHNEKSSVIHGNAEKKSISGYSFKVFGCLVSWISCKQQTGSKSRFICRAKWLRNILKEIGYEQPKPTETLEDNQSYISVAKDHKEHKWMEHIDVKYDFIRDTISNDIVEIRYTPSSSQLADIMTKATLHHNLKSSDPN